MREPVYTIDDPRPNALESPYTFFLPSPEELAALAPGDLAKLVFRLKSGGRKWDAERMWVKIDHVDGDTLEGTLDNEPEDIPGVEFGERVRFRRTDVIDCLWDEGRISLPPPRPSRREYWGRCLVDECVINEGKRVHYLYREEPEPVEESDRYPDSGWRIRGDYRGLSDDEIDARNVEYLALGSVLNVDDSWLYLLDAPVGSAFIRDWDTGHFVPERRRS